MLGALLAGARQTVRGLSKAIVRALSCCSPAFGPATAFPLVEMEEAKCR